MIKNYVLDYSIDQVWSACLRVVNEIPNKVNLLSIPEVKTIYFELDNIQTDYLSSGSIRISLDISLSGTGERTNIDLSAELVNNYAVKGYGLRETARFMQRLVAKLKELG